MKFTMVPAVLLALCANSYATPINGQDLNVIEARMGSGPGIKGVNCNGEKFSKDIISETKTEATSGQHGKYPFKFNNSDKVDGKTIFAASDKTYMEYPLANPVWTTGEPGKYRIVYTKEDGVYRGAMYKLPGDGYRRCTAE